MSTPQGGRHEHRLRTPTSALPHEEKVRRQRRHVQVLTVVLLLVLALLVYIALVDLDNWADWIVLGMICTTAVGAVIAIQARG
ncbi:MAG: hypothetical protein R2691_11300 [Solirubrobacterales bacterium]